MFQLGWMDVVGDHVENPTVKITNFCWSFIQDLKRGHNLSSSVYMIGEWLSIQFIDLLIWIACFPPNIWYFLYSEMKNWVFLNLQTLWLYQQSYVLCFIAWISFITCHVFFLNWHSWTTELTLVFPASLVQGCIWLQLKALLATWVWLQSQLNLACHLKAIRQQNCRCCQSLACVTSLQEKNQSLFLTLLSKPGNEKHCFC